MIKYLNKENKIFERVNIVTNIASSESYVNYRQEVMLNLRKNEYENYFRAKRLINIKPSLEINPNVLDTDISMSIEEVFNIDSE
jgi:hypothetical protein